MSSGRNATGDRKALFDDPKSSVRASLWIGRHKCWLALTVQQTLIGAVVLPPRPDKPMQVYAYGTERSWRGTPTARHFYDPRTWIWSISEVFAEGVFPDGVAVRLIDPLTRETVAESPHAVRSTPPRAAAKRGTTLDEAVALLGSVKSAYAGYELDPRKLLAYPALIDPQDSISATWYETFGQACALEPEDPKHCPPNHAHRFVAAVLGGEGMGGSGSERARRRPGPSGRRTTQPASSGPPSTGPRIGSGNSGRRTRGRRSHYPGPDPRHPGSAGGDQ